MKRKDLEIAPVRKRDALPEQIVRQLVGLVRSGQLKPGDRLPAERALAEEFGVGRPTLREALRALQLLGVRRPRPLRRLSLGRVRHLLDGAG